MVAIWSNVLSLSRYLAFSYSRYLAAYSRYLAAFSRYLALT